jgi:hypothetical protein
MCHLTEEKKERERQDILCRGRAHEQEGLFIAKQQPAGRLPVNVGEREEERVQTHRVFCDKDQDF